MTTYNNTLDTWYQSCSWPIQKVLATPYDTVSGWLQWVTGNPDRVAAECSTFENIGRQVTQLGADLSTTAKGISQWEGEAHSAYLEKMAAVRSNFDKLGPAIVQTREILRAAAETCVEAANMILSIVKATIEFLVTSLAVSAALAIFSFGASFVAWIAANIAEGVNALARITQGLARVAQVLFRLEQLLLKISTLLKRLAAILQELRLILSVLKSVKGSLALAGSLKATLAIAAIRAPVKLAANPILDRIGETAGVPGVSMPGMGGELWDGAGSGWDAVSASNRAKSANTGVELD